MTTDAHDTAENALTSLLEKVSSRRTFVQGAAVAGAAVAGAGVLGSRTFAQSTAADTPTQIFSIARTAERLAITFYTNGINNAAALGISGDDLTSLKAVALEEQIHEIFFGNNGGTPLTSTFSFPSGAKTFMDLNTFLMTQQQLEGAFDSAFIAAAEEFAQMGMPDLTRISCQIAMIESEHRAFGRAVGADHMLSGYDPADNNTYAPKTVPTVGAAPAVLAAAGYLSPVAGNTYTYQEISFTDPAYNSVYSSIDFKSSFVQTPTPLAAKSARPGKYVRGGRHPQ